MSILIHCSSCANDFAIYNKKCPNCQCPVSRENTRFRVRVMVKGKRRSATAESRSEARAIEARLIMDLERREEEEIREYKFDEVWAIYLESYKSRGKSWQHEEERYRKRVKPFFGDKKLSEIKVADIEKFVIMLRNTPNRMNRPNSPKTIRNIISLLSVTFNYAIKMGYFEKNNPCGRVRLPVDNSQVENILSDDELGRLLEALNKNPANETYNVLKFLLFTGIRCGEAFKLVWSDVNFEKRQITLRNPKGGKDQILPINQSAFQVLADQKVLCESASVLVFPGQFNQIRKRIWPDLWNQIKKSANITKKFRCHDLRHQYASMLASSGEVDIYTLQRLMTHKNFTTTQRYAHHFPHTLQKGAAVLDGIMDKVVKGL